MTYNIVEVVPGKYAIRRRGYFGELFNLTGQFLDLKTHIGNCWWGTGSRYLNDCLTDNIYMLEATLELLKLNGSTMKVIK